MLRSAPVVVDVGLRTEWEPPTLCVSLLDSTRFGDFLMASCSDKEIASAHPRRCVAEKFSVAP